MQSYKGLGTDLGRSEPVNMVGAQGKGSGWGMRGNEAEETRLGPNCRCEAKEFRCNLVKTTTKGSIRGFK